MTESRAVEKKYWATLPTEQLLPALERRRDDYWWILHDKNIVDTIHTFWRFYHNQFYAKRTDRVEPGGTDLDIAQLGVGDFRSFLNTILSYTLAQDPDWDAQATDATEAAADACRLSNEVLDWLMDAPQYLVEKSLRLAPEECLIYKIAYLATIYDEMLGEPVSGERKTGQLRYKGDLRLFNPTIFDVVRDVSITDAKNEKWVFFRERVNRYDLAALYFNKRDEILELSPIDRGEKDDFHGMERGIAKSEIPSDHVDLWRFFHLQTPALEKGRYVIAAGNKGLLELKDGALPPYYKRLPLHSLVHSETLGSTIVGMSPADSLGPLQEAENICMSTILTNIKKWGQSKIWAKEGEPINIAQAEPGSDVWQTNTEPQVKNLLQSAPELYNFPKDVVAMMSRVTNVSEVSRGEINRETAGIAAAFMAAQTLQGNSKFDKNYRMFCQSVGQSCLEIIQANFTEPRDLPVIGANDEKRLRQFTGQDLQLVKRIIVKPGNAATRTTAQRIALAQMFASLPEGSTIRKEIMSVIDTGRIDNLRSPQDTQRTLVNEENLLLRQGMLPEGLLGDDHVYHLNSHFAEVAGSQEARTNPVVLRVLDVHTVWHLDQITRNPMARAMNVLMGFVEPPRLMAADQVMLPMGPPPGQGNQPPPGGEELPPGPPTGPPPEGQAGLVEQTGEILNTSQQMLQNEAAKADTSLLRGG